jgi:hypothetical protein
MDFLNSVKFLNILFYSFSIFILLINGRHKKLVNADNIIKNFNPTKGNSHAPTKELAVPVAKLDTPHNKAKEVASFPFKEFFAIIESTIK